MSELTRAEFYEKYGKCVVKFSNYFKYTFTYIGTFTLENGDEVRVVVNYGGNANEIYRHSVPNNDSKVLEILQPYFGEVYKDGNIVDSFYDY